MSVAHPRWTVYPCSDGTVSVVPEDGDPGGWLLRNWGLLACLGVPIGFILVMVWRAAGQTMPVGEVLIFSFVWVLPLLLLFLRILWVGLTAKELRVGSNHLRQRYALWGLKYESEYADGTILLRAAHEKAGAWWYLVVAATPTSRRHALWISWDRDRAAVIALGEIIAEHTGWRFSTTGWPLP